MIRSTRRKQRVIIIVDRAGIHTLDESRLVAELLKPHDRRLRHVPSCSLECRPATFRFDFREQRFNPFPLFRV